MIYQKKKLPQSIKIDSDSIAIRTDFHSWIKFGLISQDKELNDLRIRVELMLECVVKESVKGVDLNKLINALFSFYKLNKEIKDIPKSLQSTEEPYSFEIDWDLIYTSFKQQYGVNLLEEELHWFEFKGMLDNLNQDTPLMRIVGYRTTDISKIKDAKQKKTASDLKKYYSLGKVQKKKSSKDIERELLERVKGG